MNIINAKWWTQFCDYIQLNVNSDSHTNKATMFQRNNQVVSSSQSRRYKSKVKTSSSQLVLDEIKEMKR